MPAVSVLMPVYNAEKHVEEAIESILNQTFSDFEFLIIDDGSTDRSAAIVRSFTDSRIIFIRNQKNGGIAEVLNQAISLSKGKYIARMDADDISFPERFEKQYRFLESHSDYVLCGSSFQIIGKNKVHYLPESDDEIKLKMLLVTPFCHPTVMLRSTLFKEKGLSYRSEMVPVEDHDLWTRIFSFGKLHNLRESLLGYRVHESNSSLKPRTAEQISNSEFLRRRYIWDFFQRSGVTEFEVERLVQLFFNHGTWSYDDLKITGDCLHEIVNRQASYPIDSSKVYEFLGRQYFYRCTRSTYLGIKSFVLANRFSFVNISLINNVKLLVKSIFKYSPV
jgi:glycosyltransferase involved in cell wall biosynthesis